MIKLKIERLLQMPFLSRYALVNIVMGDIADIEKKKSKGLSTLLLGAKPNQMVQVLKKLGFGRHFFQKSPFFMYLTVC